MQVVGMDVRFPMALVSPQEDTQNVIYDVNTTHGSARSCDLPRFRKTNLSTFLYTELDLGLFMKNVDMNVRFIFVLVRPHLYFHNLSYV